MNRLRFAALVSALCLLTGCALPWQNAQTDAAASAEPAEVSASAVPTPTTSASEATAVKTDGTVTLPCDTTSNLNPFTSLSISNQTLCSLLFEGLFTLAPDFSAEPALCESYTVSDDQMTYVFTIRQASFHSGSAVTAADVTASLERAKTSTLYAKRFADITSIEATGALEVTITLSKPVESLPELLDMPIVRSGTEERDLPDGTGPYIYETRDGGGVLTPFTGWWNGTATINTIALHEDNTMQQARDDFEYGALTMDVTDSVSIAASLHVDYELWNSATTTMQYIGFNGNSAIFSKQALRAAVTYAVDRASIVANSCGGMALAATLPASPASGDYDEALSKTYSYDLDKLQKAITDTGLETGEDGVLMLDDETPASGIFLVCSDSVQVLAAARSVCDTLNDAGFDLTLDALSYDDYCAALKAGSYDLYYAETSLSPNFDLTAFFASGGSLNYGGLADDTVRTLCASALENSGNFYNLHKYVLEQGLLCPVLFRSRAVCVQRGRLSGLNPSPDNVFYSLTGISAAEG